MEALSLTTYYLSGLILGFALILTSDILVGKKEPIAETALCRDTSESPSGRSLPQILILVNLNALIWSLTYLRHGSTVQTAAALAALSLAFAITSADLCARAIPNTCIAALLGAGVLVTFFRVFGGSPVSHFIGLGIGLLVFSIPYLIGSSIGAGDAKYLAAIGFFLGYPGVLYALVFLTAILIAWIIVMSLAGRKVIKKTIALGPFLSAAFAATLLIYR